jgi:sigma-B regulation protein RsbU (phosphoserine phosphatase)
MKLVNNGLLKRQIDARYATVFFATLTPGGVLTYCNAGHNPPVVVRPSGVRQLASGSVPVGLFSSATYADERIQLEPGDVLVIYSDGVTEALNLAGDEFGDERLAAELIKTRTSPLPDILQGVITAVQAFAAGASQSDDVTVLVARYMGPEGNVAAAPPA